MGMRLIDSAVVSGTSTYYVTFSSIPQTYKDLYISITARNSRSDAMWGYCYLTFNSETINAGTNQFARKGSYLANDGGQSYESTSLAAIGWGMCTDYQSTNTFGITQVHIMDYTNTSNKKCMRIYDGSSNANSTASETSGNSWGSMHWGDTSAISTIKVSCPSDKYLKADTVVRLYGIE